LNTQPEEHPSSSACSPLHAKMASDNPRSLLEPHPQMPEARPMLQPWSLANTFTPQWMPKQWQHPLLGYVMAMLLELAAASMTLLSVHHLPVFAVQGALVILAIVLSALTWGRGPGLLAALVGTVLLEFVVLPAYFPWFLNDPSDAVCVGMFLLVGILISLVASQSGWARHQAEELACSLRQTQAKVERERLRLRTLLDVLPAAVGMMDARGRVLENNPATRALWGEDAPRAGEMAQPQTWHGWWPDTGKPLAQDDWAITRALTRGVITVNQEVEVAASNGQRKVILDSAVPIRDERGAILGAVGIHQDFTERKRLEEALRESERRAAAHASELEAIFETMTDALFVYDAQGRILRHNTAARHIVAFDAQPDIVSLPFHERAARYAPLDEQGQPFPFEQLALNRILRGEVFTSSHAADERFRALDGRELLANITGAPLRDSNGTITGAVAILRDVTERRRLEQHTHTTLNALLAMAEALVQAPDKASAAGNDGSPDTNQVARHLAELTRSVLECQYVGIAAVEPGTGKMTPITIVGLSPEQEQQWWASWNEHSHLGQHLHPADIAALQAGEPVLVNSLRTPFPKGRVLTPGCQSIMVPMRVGETLVGILRVEGGTMEKAIACTNRKVLIRAVAKLGALVLERERLLRERAEAQASEMALRAANAQMDTFLGMVGHELKTPLTSMKLALQLAERRSQQSIQRKPDTASAAAPFLELAARALLQADRLDRLVNDLLDVSRVQAGKLEFHPEAVDLATIVREAADEQRQANPTRALILQFPTDLSVPVIADADRIGQVVTNYLTNALKYSPAERPVNVGLAVEGQQARVWVHDEGPGLPAEEQERVWERFHRARGIQVQSGTGVGLGLGLHVCRIIIERHQGQVGIESAPGQGSTFWFSLSLAETHQTHQ
jgi:PAS domain S-box-containing protein